MCADVLSPKQRSDLMSRVRGRDTGPEKALRRILTDLGFRYRLQYEKAPGRPDVAFPGLRKLIWVHGCFWHRHPGCPKATMPKTRQDYWIPKLQANRERDLAVEAAAQASGWKTLIIWECEMSDDRDLARRLVRFLKSDE